jgi:hypothetical protein
MHIESMALAFDNLSNEAILQLLEKLPLNDDLYTMTYSELEAVASNIDKITHIYHDDKKLCEKLIRLKALTSLVGEYARKRDEEYR